jgi:hypothetical protein
MKKIHFLIGIPFLLFVVLIATKPSQDRCKKEFESDIKSDAEGDYLRSDTSGVILLAGMKLDAAKSYSENAWENYFEYKDYFIFCIVRSNGLKNAKTIGYGVLNSTIHLMN